MPELPPRGYRLSGDLSKEAMTNLDVANHLDMLRGGGFVTEREMLISLVEVLSEEIAARKYATLARLMRVTPPRMFTDGEPG